MKILVINNDGGGFADYVDIVEGTTAQELFEQQVRSPNPENYLIRVNRQPVPADQVLREGDRISFTPTKIEGARVGPLRIAGVPQGRGGRPASRPPSLARRTRDGGRHE